MTQAYNLAILANAVDTSGRLNVGTNATGTLPVANGGTGTSSPSLVAGSGITITGSFPNQTIASSGGAGTVTSVATGNGLQGGTITTSGTLSVACPGFNTVGSYCFGGFNNNISTTSGATYSAGSLQSTTIFRDDEGESGRQSYQNNLSGTWRWMGSSFSAGGTTNNGSLICRVS
jgi:hypothetical protein